MRLTKNNVNKMASFNFCFKEHLLYKIISDTNVPNSKKIPSSAFYKNTKVANDQQQQQNGLPVLLLKHLH